MKKNIYALLLCLILCVLQAQPPQKINYQGVALNPTLTAPLAQGTNIRVRVSILEGSCAATSSVYSQSQTVTTGPDGIYTITIGSGDPTAFGNINWQSQDKFVKVEVGPATGTDYPQSGCSQLMSVPYAYYAKYANSMTSFSIKENMAALRTAAGNAAGEIAYVLGYNSPGDGGGGFFIWKTDNIFKTSASGYYSVHNGGTIVQVNGSVDTGRWIRQFDGAINVKYFGAMGVWGNYTKPIQDAIDFAELVSTGSPDFFPHFQSSTVFIPSGSYIIDSVLLKDGVSIKGENMEKTLIFPTAASSDYIIKMEIGRVRTNISDLAFLGSFSGSESVTNGFSGNNPKGLFYLQSQIKSTAQGGYNDGGLWMSTFKNILISGFKGHSMYLQGSSTGYINHNNSVVFENIRIYKGDPDADINALRIEGANSLYTFTNCEFAGTRYSGYSKNKTVFLKGYYPGGNSPVLPANISFINCTFRSADYGLYLDYTENVTVDNCSFRELGYGIYVDGTTRACAGTNILNNRFYNVPGYGNINPGTGYVKDNSYCIEVKNSMVNVRGNYAGGDDICNTCGFLNALSNNLGVNMYGNTSSIAKLNKTKGVMQQLQQTGSMLNCGQNKVLSVTNSGTINILDSSINTGETLTIKASSALVFSKTGIGANITFPGVNTTMSLAIGDIVKFIKTDSAFHVVSVIKNNP